MRLFLTSLLLAAAPLFGFAEDPPKRPAVTVDVFAGEVATVNSYIFSNGQSMIVMDVQRATSEAKKLADMLQAKDIPLTHILLSHGHPDHYIGMDWLHKTFPDAKIVVASQAIKDDIIGFSSWMESVGWLDAEPTLKPKSSANPQGFDYEANIAVLESDTLTLSGGGELDLTVHDKPAEATHLTTVYVKDSNSLFTGDFGYNQVHLWMGQGVTKPYIQNWRQALLALQRDYAERDPVVYPGHGEPTDVGLFAEMIRYIDDFTRVVASATVREQAMDEMTRLYPNYAEADFLLRNSVDFHVPENQASAM